MKWPLGWLQLRHQPLRLLIAVAGIGFAVMLVLMQLGFRGALFESTTRFHERFRYDIALFSADSLYLVAPETFSQRRLYQALADDAVDSVSPVYISLAKWKNPWSSDRRRIFTVGVRPSHDVLDTVGFPENLGLIERQDAAVFDDQSRPEFGAVGEALRNGEAVATEVNDREIDIVGLFEMGPSFGIDGTVITSDDNFLRLFPEWERDAISLGLIRLKDPAAVDAATARLRELLPDDVAVMTKAEFITAEQRYWDSATPIGYVFAFGALMGLVVGAIIVYQILFADVSDHLGEYAVLRAIGFPKRFVYGIVLQQATILAVFGFVPGALLANWLYNLAGGATQLPLIMTQGRLIAVFLLILGLCIGSAFMALDKVRRVDPAEVF